MALAALTILGCQRIMMMPTSENPFPLDAAGEQWVWTTLDSLSLEERVGQMVHSHFPWEDFSSPEVVARLTDEAMNLRLGGTIVGGPSAHEVAPLLESIQAQCKVPLLVCADFEAGTGVVWSDGTRFPTEMALAATGDPNNARLVGEWTAREARACGVQWVLTPVCDVNINPDNPIINIRSYGEDVGTVERFADAFIAGCQGAGAMACAKHYPGHGDTTTDSHMALATVNRDLSRLQAVEFPPFQSAIDHGVCSVMTSHIWFPALMGSEGRIPATVSHNVMTRLLRDRMHFRGLLTTDSMRMSGITDLYQPGEAAVRAVEAGVDVILVSKNNEAAIAALLAAVRSGRLTEERIAQSAERILRAKAWLGLNRSPGVNPAVAFASLQNPEAMALAKRMEREAITVVRNDGDLLPLDPSKYHSVFHMALYDSYRGWEPDDLDLISAGLASRLGPVTRQISFREPNRRLIARFADITPEMATDELVARFCLPPTRRESIVSHARQADVIVVTTFVRVAARLGHVDLSADQIALIRALAATGRPLVLVALGSPYIVRSVPEVPCQVLTYDPSTLSAEAVPAALAGEFPITGHLPVSLPGIAEFGEGLQIPARE